MGGAFSSIAKGSQAPITVRSRRIFRASFIRGPATRRATAQAQSDHVTAALILFQIDAGTPKWRHRQRASRRQRLAQLFQRRIDDRAGLGPFRTRRGDDAIDEILFLNHLRRLRVGMDDRSLFRR